MLGESSGAGSVMPCSRSTTRAIGASSTAAKSAVNGRASEFVGALARGINQAPKGGLIIETTCARFVVENAVPNLW